MDAGRTTAWLKESCWTGMSIYHYYIYLIQMTNGADKLGRRKDVLVLISSPNGTGRFWFSVLAQPQRTFGGAKVSHALRKRPGRLFLTLRAVFWQSILNAILHLSHCNADVSFLEATEGSGEKEAMFMEQRRLLQTSGVMVSKLPHVAGNTRSCSPSSL